jgi:hypothetical protein
MMLPDFDSDLQTGNKVIRTFRMHQSTVHCLGREATQRGLDLTALVLRILRGYLNYFSLPEAAVAQLEADRQALSMERDQYLCHLLYHRCLALREYGPGFDDPRIPETWNGARNPNEPPPRTVPAEPDAAQDRPLGAAGGGTNAAVPGMAPGAGIWPYGSAKPRPKG